MKTSLLLAELEGFRNLGIAHGGFASSRVVILGLGESMTSTSRLEPRTTFRRSALEVELVKVLKLECLFDILVIVASLLLGILGTDFFVLCLGQTSRDVRFLGKLSLLQL